MVSSREWVYQTLLVDTNLTTSCPGGVQQQGAILTSQSVKPYLVYHFGNQTDEGMADPDNAQPNRQYLMVYVHVAQGDYGPIDAIVTQVKAALATLTGRPASLIQVQYLETSQDLQDITLQTWFRYIRFQLIQSS